MHETGPGRGSVDKKQMVAIVTLSIAVHFEEGEEPIAVMEAAFARDHEGVLGEVIEPTVDSIVEEKD